MTQGRKATGLVASGRAGWVAGAADPSGPWLGLAQDEVRNAFFDAVGEIDLDQRWINEVDTDRIRELLQARGEQVIEHVAQSDPFLTASDLQGAQHIVPEATGVLPSQPPLVPVSPLTRFASVPALDRKEVRIVGYGFDTTLELANVVGSRVTVAFEPATAEDAAAIERHGGLLNTPVLAASLRPVLLVDGVAVVKGGPAPLGTFFNIFVQFRIRGVSLDVVSHVVTTGGTYSVVLDTQSIPMERLNASRDRLAAALAAGSGPLSEEVAGEALHLIGLGWYRYTDIVSDYMVGNARGRISKPFVSEALVGQDLSVRFADGALRMSLGEQFIDAKRSVLSIVSRDGDPKFPKKPLFLTIGAAASSYEDGVFRTLLGMPAASTEFYLEEAFNHEVPIYSIDESNLESVLPELDDELLEAIQNGTVKKELMIVRNNDAGQTIAKTIGKNPDLGIGSSSPVKVSQVNLGRVVNRGD